MARLLVRLVRMLVGLLGVLMSGLRVLLRFLMIALLVVFGRGVMRFRGMFVVLGCFAVCFVRHKSSYDPDLG